MTRPKTVTETGWSSARASSGTATSSATPRARTTAATDRRTSAGPGGEEALGPDRQHAGHEDVDQHRGERRPGPVRSLGAPHAPQQRRKEGAAHRVDEADEQRGG